MKETQGDSAIGGSSDGMGERKRGGLFCFVSSQKIFTHLRKWGL